VLLSFVSIIISAIALSYSKKAWHKSRAVYGVERMVVRQFTGKCIDADISEDKINRKLSSGLSVLERTKGDNDWEMLLGRITPYNKNRLNK